MRLLLVTCMLLCANVASGHEMRPAFLKLTQLDSTGFEIQFRQPVVNGAYLGLRAVVNCPQTTATEHQSSGTGLTQTYRVNCEDKPLREISIEGLSYTTTEVLVQVSVLEAAPANYMIRPEQPVLMLGRADTPLLPVYLALGIEHLLQGIDHVLFIIGLMLLIRDRWQLLKAITAFTVAHSITLGLSTLDLVRVSQAPVEATIALSILYVAVEITRPDRDRSLTARFPWAIAFAFGLLHGLGFAGVLRDIGLPEQDALWALLLFNVGIECGQLVVIGAVITLAQVTTRTSQHFGTALPPRWAHLATAYVIGSVSVFWLFERVLPA